MVIGYAQHSVYLFQIGIFDCFGYRAVWFFFDGSKRFLFNRIDDAVLRRVDHVFGKVYPPVAVGHEHEAQDQACCGNTR